MAEKHTTLTLDKIELEALDYALHYLLFDDYGNRKEIPESALSNEHVVSLLAIFNVIGE